VYGPSWVIKDPLELEEMSPQQLGALGVSQANEFFERHPIDETGKMLSATAIEVFLECP